MFKGFSVCVALLLLFAGALFSEEATILSSSVDTTDSASIRSPETVGLTLGTGSENVAVRNKLMVGSTTDPSYTLDVAGITYSSNGFHVATKDDITGRTNSGFWQTSSASTAEGWPENAGWYHLLASTHSNFGNYYSMQFAADFYNSNDLFYRSTNGSGTTGWNRIWHSGNDGSGSGLDADLLDGHHASYFAPASGNVTGSGSSNYIPKWTGAHTLGNSIIYDNGNVGIGTTSPSAKLDVAGTSEFNGNMSLTNHDITGVNAFHINDPGDQEGIIWDGSQAKIFVSPLNSGNSDGYLRLINDGGIVFEASGEDNENMIITSSGNVGIGTTSPKAKLDVNGYIVMRTTVVKNHGFEAGNYSYWTKTNGCLSPGVVQSNKYAAEGDYAFGAEGSGTYSGSNALIWAIEQDVPNVHVITEASRLRFYTYGTNYCKYAHWHVVLTYTDGTTTTICSYITYGAGIPSDRVQLYEIELYAKGASLGKTVSKIKIEFRKDHSGYARNKPTIFIDAISLYYE